MSKAVDEIVKIKVDSRNMEIAADLIQCGESDDERIARLAHLSIGRVGKIRAGLNTTCGGEK